MNKKKKKIIANLIGAAITVGTMGGFMIVAPELENGELSAETIKQIDAQKKAEEEAKAEEAKKAEDAKKTEEAKRQAEEAKRQAEEEAKRQAEEEAKRQAEEEAKKQAEEEAKRQAEEEQRQAEEEAKRQADEAKRLFEEAAAKKRIKVLTQIPEGIRIVPFHIEYHGNPAYTNELYVALQTYLPDGVKEFLYQNNITIHFIEGTTYIEKTGKLECTEELGDIRGLNDPIENAVYIETYNPKYYKFSDNYGYDEYTFNYIQAMDIMFHEIGHFIDCHLKDEMYPEYALSDDIIFGGDVDENQNVTEGIYQRSKNSFRNTEEFNLGNLGAECNISTKTEMYATGFSAYIFDQIKINQGIDLGEDSLINQCNELYNYIDLNVKEAELKGYMMANENTENYTPQSKEKVCSLNYAH